MNEIVVAASCTRFFKYCFKVVAVGASPPACARLQLTSPAEGVSGVRQGTKASRTSGAASLRNAIPGGNRVKIIASTTTSASES